jgi:tRNA pseudouridine32 synthase/23S rRNA pseudouridine746 synthase
MNDDAYAGRAARLYLPKLAAPPATILEYLIARFSQIEPAIWRNRTERGVIRLSNGTVMSERTPYLHGLTVFYRRQVAFEPAGEHEPLLVLHRDEHILVVDKPHGMPVTPVGQYVERSLLVKLEQCLGLEDLTPLHRLDRDTAGLLLVGVNPATRGLYHALFAERSIEKEYLAIADVTEMPSRTKWLVENRIEPGDPWFRQQIVEGRANACTEIELLEIRGQLARVRLRPQTGRKHQLRLHMSYSGLPIVGDPFYPNIRDKQEGEPPLQLLATRLSFIDPVSGERRTFTSARSLMW